ncbi:MAG: polysulfide reductase NrfD [Actinobacteria bacterium]|nr:polysulfide reductase NrfD [Actinomycetota bacterium]
MAFERLSWGILLTNFIFLLGLTQGALSIAVILRLSSARWSAGFFRLAANVALFVSPLAVLMLLVVLGGYSTFNLAREASHPWNSSLFFLARHLLSFLAFYVAAWVLLKTDMAKRTVLALTPFLLIAFVVNETFVAWDMGMMLNHGFADAIYAPFFIAGSIYGGVALFFLIMAGVRRYLHSTLFAAEHFKNMAQLLLGFSLIWAYFWWSQFITIWYANLPEETETLYTRIFSPSYNKIYFATMALIWVIPFSLLVFKKVRESVGALSAISASVLIGLWLDRYLIVMPSLAEKHEAAGFPLSGAVVLLVSLAFLSALAFAFAKRLARKPAILSASEDVIGWQ